MACNTFTTTTYVAKFPIRTKIEVLPADEFEHCPLCRIDVRKGTLDTHCRIYGDADHMALEILEA